MCGRAAIAAPMRCSTEPSSTASAHAGCRAGTGVRNALATKLGERPSSRSTSARPSRTGPSAPVPSASNIACSSRRRTSEMRAGAVFAVVDLRKRSSQPRASRSSSNRVLAISSVLTRPSGVAKYERPLRTWKPVRANSSMPRSTPNEVAARAKSSAVEAGRARWEPPTVARPSANSRVISARTAGRFHTGSQISSCEESSSSVVTVGEPPAAFA